MKFLRLGKPEIGSFSTFLGCFYDLNVDLLVELLCAMIVGAGSLPQRGGVLFDQSSHNLGSCGRSGCAYPSHLQVAGSHLIRQTAQVKARGLTTPGFLLV